MSGARVLLVGGTGFIGGHVCRGLVAAGHDVTIVSRGRRPVPDGVQAITVDRRDPEALGASLEGLKFDATVDFTAYDATDVERLLLIPYAALGRYTLISTGQVYLVTDGGRPPYAEEDSDRPLMREPDPSTPDHREWRYGVGKRRAENALFSLRETHGVRGVALRLPIVQGEGDGSLRLWAYLERLLDGGPLLLPDGGEQPLRHVHAADVARAVLELVVRTPSEAVYNLAQLDVVTLRGFLERVARLAGCEPHWVEASWEELSAEGFDASCSPYAGRWSSLLDPGRALGEGFATSRLDDYLPAVVAWHLEHRPAASHPGYAARERELAFAASRAARTGAG